MAEGWRKWHNEKLHHLYSSSHIYYSHGQVMSRRIRWSQQEMLRAFRKDVYNILVGRPEGNRPLGLP
jgi:hypothetical protein